MLELRRLRYLVVLAKRLSYSRAAEELGLSQSALSRAIQSLERELDIRLFDRDRAGVLLTEQGRWIVEKAEALLTSATDFEHQVGFVAKGAEGRTRFGLSDQAGFASQLTLSLRERLASSLQVISELTALRSLVRETDAIWLTSSYAVADDLAAGTLEQLPMPSDLGARPFEVFMYSLMRRTKSPSVLEIEEAFRTRIKGLSGQFLPSPNL